jgi:hypothetical protein
MPDRIGDGAVQALQRGLEHAERCGVKGESALEAIAVRRPGRCSIDPVGKTLQVVAGAPVAGVPSRVVVCEVDRLRTQQQGFVLQRAEPGAVGLHGRLVVCAGLFEHALSLVVQAAGAQGEAEGHAHNQRVGKGCGGLAGGGQRLAFQAVAQGSTRLGQQRQGFGFCGHVRGAAALRRALAPGISAAKSANRQGTGPTRHSCR